MMQRFIHHVRVERPASTESAAEARDRLRDLFPRTSLRRMTHLGLLVGSTLRDLEARSDDALVYASTFAETRALEDFLASFPAASPMLFQTSIHPGAVQQVLIGRQQPVARLWPLAGRSRLVEQALLTALLEPAPRVIVTGGEERGTWLLDHGMASDRAFAFAMTLTADSVGALGVLRCERGAGPTTSAAATAAERTSGNGQTSRPAAGARTHELETIAARGACHRAERCPTSAEFADALAERRPLEWQSGSGGWTLGWS